MIFGKLSVGDCFILWCDVETMDEEGTPVFRKIEPVRDERQGLPRNAIVCHTSQFVTIANDNARVVKIEL